MESRAFRSESGAEIAVDNYTLYDLVQLCIGPCAAQLAVGRVCGMLGFSKTCCSVLCDYITNNFTLG